ncbi:hypothetical protein [Streptomyces sp. NPDC091416]|uniref:hypothetical protein n=1 Tax=Streptomyces sp. NPDC091416 TaxID=3366003 RepID=UPI00382F910D
MNPDRLSARRTPPPMKPFADEITAVDAMTAPDRDTRIPAWVLVTRTPLEHLTRQQPPARTDDDGGTTA